MPNLFILMVVLIFLTIPGSSNLDEFIYNGFNQVTKTNISLSGVANINKHGILQLTNDTSRLMGHALFSSPIQLKNSSTSPVHSFSTCFAFSIVPEYPKLGGHGLAFTITPSKDFVNFALPSQYLGLLNATDLGNFSNHLLAVEFDTVQDFEFGDINDNHVGININSLESNKSAKAAYFTDDFVGQDINLKSGKRIMAWIDYESSTNLLNVTISPSSSKPKIPIISYHLDLSPIFEQNMYVGFSASTGLLASSHYVMGWSFKVNGIAKFLDLNSLPSFSKPKKNHPALIVLVLILALFVSISSIFLAIYVMKKIKERDVIEDWELDIGPHRYSYQELKKATRGFKDSELLGIGGFGKVYKGILPNLKTVVAVKRISNGSKQGLREFVSEISTIGRLRHRNLVQLQGWCRRGGDLLLVYEFMPNGSLDVCLFDEPKFILSWEQRINIIKGVASGLLYLHEGFEQVVIHRDIKASNVLLDCDLNGRLGDFGLAKLHDHGENPGTTRVVGTLGYLAPEVPRTGRATASSDVFAFGALLLEVVCGRRPIEHKAAPNEFILVDWVWCQFVQGKAMDVVDAKLKGEYDGNEVLMVIKLGLMCSNNEALIRPKMRDIVRYLEGEIGLPDVVTRPGGYPDRRAMEGFNNLLGLYPSSSFENGSQNSLGRNEDADRSFASISTSPLPLLYTREEAR
ncbi:Clade XI lectin receptor kinase [Heracleum sosnowskyi]|uniref:non-specific serine/threonine protein kinase n=1 Tax=Heracleum sosnowskyi TaxID=360622 RepID=A0AAD8M7V8_9APIA|nr:Clade XI lectin receptor kinase [Heracleum sosnowskyi]